MILQFSVSNFRSLRGLETLDLVASNYDKSLPENLIQENFPGLKGKRWIKAAVLYGANASGKSTVIAAMESLSNWVSQSAKTTDPDEVIPSIEPFALDPNALNEPTAFAVVFVTDGIRYEYRVAATRYLIIHESLRAWPVGKEQIWFERDWNPELGSHDFSPENPKGLPRNRDIEQRTLRNMLYLSKAVAENRKELRPVFRWFVSQIQFLDLGVRSDLSNSFTLQQIDGEDSELRSKIIDVLKHADIGITDARSVNASQPKGLIEKLNESVVQESQLAKIRKLLKNHKQPELLHRGLGGTELALDWRNESAGTHRLFALIGPWLDILKNGYTVCIDEMETSMHPLMVRELLKLFFCEKENSGGAQVIFTSHNPLFLDPTLLRRDQVWFTDKDDEGVTHLYPLTDFQPRKEESYIRGYMVGRYGAIPFVPRGLLGHFSPTYPGASKKEERHV